MPVNLKVLDGTRSDQKDLCPICTNSLIFKGAGDSEEIRYCDSPNPAIKIPFKIVECNNFKKKGEVSLHSMAEIAWIVRTDSNRKNIGFFSPRDFRKKFEDEDVIPGKNY